MFVGDVFMSRTRIVKGEQPIESGGLHTRRLCQGPENAIGRRVGISKDKRYRIDAVPGLNIDDFYMRCFITDGEPVYFVPGLDMCTYKFKLASEYPFWIHEESRSFPPISSNTEGEESYLDYEHDYPYDYTMPYGGDVIWNVDHYAPCEFLMTIFGPAVDPRVVINGHPYQVYTTLDANEYLQIDSRANTVVKYLANGIRQDIYDYRAKQESVFNPITPGDIGVVWSGEFGFDITLYCERSEPRWKT